MKKRAHIPHNYEMSYEIRQGGVACLRRWCAGILREILNDFARNLEYLQESLNKQAVSGSSIFKNAESLHCLEASVPLVLLT
jgi:hypothetical protein